MWLIDVVLSGRPKPTIGSENQDISVLSTRRRLARVLSGWSGGSVVVFFEESVTATVKDPLQGRTLLTVGLKYESVRQRTDRSER